MTHNGWYAIKQSNQKNKQIYNKDFLFILIFHLLYVFYMNN